MAKCKVCGGKIPFMCAVKIVNGKVCFRCSHLSGNCKLDTLEKMKDYKRENDKRIEKFVKTDELESVNSANVEIDKINQLFFVYDKIFQNVYRFDEVKGHGSQQIGNTISEINERTSVINSHRVYKIWLNTHAGKKEIIVADPPPNGLASFLDNCMNINQTTNTPTSAADEILKFKLLWEQGVITQEEFEAKKRQLLNL